jgi:NAD(P)-dependent dehydrogenase (short-subunit alcohol dehydrogenase family)
MLFLCVLAAVLYAVYRYVMSVLGRQRIDAIESRYIFITGCDTGFGLLAAKRFDRLGCHVIAGCLTERGEEELKKVSSSRLHTVHLNVASHVSVTKAAEVVKQMLPPNTGKIV